MADTGRLSRPEIARMVGDDPRSIAAFEDMQFAATESTPAQVEALETGKADKGVTIATGSGLTGGGDLSGDRTLELDVPNVSELIRDVIATALTEGAGVTITVDDAGDTITIRIADDPEITGSLSLTMGPLNIASDQVVGARLAALPADATDLASVIALANAIKARIKTTGGHGLVED